MNSLLRLDHCKVVSSSFKRQPQGLGDVVHWDLGRVEAFMDAARRARGVN